MDTPTPAFPIRQACPPGACICDRAVLLNDPGADARILRLTREEEKRLVARLEAIDSFQDLQRLRELMLAQLGLVVHIMPSRREVRTMRGILIQVERKPGVCRKIRRSIPAAIRRSLERHPDIAYEILNANDLLGGI